MQRGRAAETGGTQKELGFREIIPVRKGGGKKSFKRAAQKQCRADKCDLGQVTLPP